MTKRATWTAEDTALFIKHYPDSTEAELVELFGGRYTVKQIRGRRKRLKIHKSDEYRQRHGINSEGRFTEGIVPFNKGKAHPSVGNSSKHWFRRGMKPANHRPVGSTRLSKDGYIEIKVAEGRFKWRLLHREVWKKHHGSYPPKGHAIVFIDGNKQNCDINNLQLITRAELMQRNTVHNLPKYLAELIQLNGQLKRKINERR
ncbi:HNH endonuclease signature motif containing protein [Nitrosomonas marina]|uniref:HNH endonuclease n=1 Tax=Nitrosomonas marina TaxID=917 RepID=A0A1H8GKK6_9PROT|nr:HNH endonuclease signature motif containing protein [Nitrosomonas marina]SEN44284.1 HNH endonuclease [Nitrosomonas marina]